MSDWDDFLSAKPKEVDFGDGFTDILGESSKDGRK